MFNHLCIQNHVGKNCQKLYTPHQFPELKPVNSVVCEQQVYQGIFLLYICYTYLFQFKVSNNKTNVKAMNKERFNHFWLYVLDIHNHKAVGDIRLYLIYLYDIILKN